jgi:hypothetical protein
MSTLNILGSIGIGAVMGWLTGLLEPRQLRISQLLAILFANGLILLEIVVLAGWQIAIVALCSGFLTFLIHKLWRRELRNR